MEHDVGNDLVIELIGGIEPARSLILEAMEHGAAVVTANNPDLEPETAKTYNAGFIVELGGSALVLAGRWVWFGAGGLGAPLLQYLAAAGVGAGDRVLIYLPMIPAAPVAMLACARLGAVHSVVFGGFAPAELASRIDDCRPVAVVTATGGIEPTRRIEYLPAVEEALRAKLAEAGAVGERWTSWKEESGWVVKLEFTANDVDHDARWSFDPRRSSLAPQNADATQLSRQGSLPEGLIPRLRALDASPLKDSSRFDSGAFGPRRLDLDTEAAAPEADIVRPEMRAPVTAAVQDAAIKRAPDHAVTSAETAALLEALRRRRGQREPMPVDEADDLLRRAFDGLQEILQGRAALVVPVLGVVDRGLGARQLAGDVRHRLLIGPADQR